jgi:hypothetical protein
MRSMRAVVPLALAVGLITAAPAAADAKAPKRAHAAGGDVVTLTYPSLVQVRIGRTERALERATRKIENGKVDKGATTLKVVRRQLSAAWRGAKYVVRTAPPPPADDARVGARKAGDPPVGPTYASPPDTAFRVLTLQHDVAAAMVALIDGAHGTGLNALSTTLNQVNDRRDQALAYILSVAPPVPPEDDAADAARVRAHVSQEEDAVPTFDTVMPALNPQIDDELQAIDGTRLDATDLTAGGRRLLNAADTQVTKTKAFVATNWPLVPPED